MTENSPTPALAAQDFEALVETLPYWARVTYYPAIEKIERVRKILQLYDKIQIAQRTSGTKIAS
jgi:hypothetical protein